MVVHSIEINYDLRESETAQDDVSLDKILGISEVIFRGYLIFFDADIDITFTHFKALLRPLSRIEYLPFI